MYFQGYNFLCGKCKNLFFKHRWQVCRHLQEHHSGIQYQCTLCNHIYLRRNIRHGCNAAERDFEHIHVESGDKGSAARQRLETFVREIVPTSWEYVPPSITESGASTPKYQVKSQVTRIEKSRNRNSNPKTDRAHKISSTRVSTNGGKKTDHRHQYLLRFPSSPWRRSPN